MYIHLVLFCQAKTALLHWSETPEEYTLHDSQFGRLVASLDRKCLGQKAFRGSGTSIRGIFDKETRRKPLVFAADARLWGLNRLSPVIDRIYDSCRNGAKVKKANKNENVRLRHDSRSLAREASAATAA